MKEKRIKKRCNKEKIEYRDEAIRRRGNEEERK